MGIPSRAERCAGGSRLRRRLLLGQLQSARRRRHDRARHRHRAQEEDLHLPGRLSKVLPVRRLSTQSHVVLGDTGEDVARLLLYVDGRDCRPEKGLCTVAEGRARRVMATRPLPLSLDPEPSAFHHARYATQRTTTPLSAAIRSSLPAAPIDGDRSLPLGRAPRCIWRSLKPYRRALLGRHAKQRFCGASVKHHGKARHNHCRLKEHNM
mmetsp:Transcript_17682/g.52371  ORF Transcript_17682/g.52371 Transcript_17682/m.52371 type:complete len:209 (+) Transcript_17682:226-852(+)